MIVFVIAVLLPAVAADSDVLVPANLREGHRYFIEIDNMANTFIYKPIAVALTNGDLSFGEYDEKKGCASFAPHKQGEFTICDNKFFLMHSSYKSCVRTQLKNIIQNRVSCTNLFPKIENRLPVLVKEDISNPHSKKFIGTYAKDRDEIVYLDKQKRKVKIRKAMDKVNNGKVDSVKYDSICLSPYKFS
ncbi:hypothetical protein Q1695_010785 [Nippostrongylus brasiliensis]|nr:hypothetical protein Q1695_010785 [Nippostrongylus brasiliensis]